LENHKGKVTVKFIDNLKVFFADARTEFKKISWPTRDEVKDSTIIVCTTIVFVMVVLGTYDLGIVGIANFAQKLFSK
jgi:preprotein translocase subunit SecE